MSKPLSAPSLFQALGDSTRLRIIALLTAEGELCVCELTHALDLSQPMISRHLGNLRAAGMVAGRRAGKWMHYRLHPDLPKWAQQVLTQTLTGILRNDPFRSDRAALRGMANRPFRRCA